MTLTMGLRYKNPDASADINLRLKDVANKGFVVGGRVTPVSGALQVTVEPFVCITYDGAVVRSDANVVLNPGDGTTPPTSVGVTVIALRARYVPLGSPIMVVQAMPVESYLIDPEINWLTVLAIVDLTSGAPHSEVPADAILTTWTNGTNTVERHTVDPQGRSSFRGPVANSGELFTPGSQYLPPLADNRNGDVRLALDTGSFFWWNEVGGLWEIFDEVPLNTHRDHEHTNGITGDSAPTTLQPSVTGGNTINIAAVPVGSGYTVNGRYVTAPTPMPFSQNIAGDIKFSRRGLIQASSNQLGAITIEDAGDGDYRVQISDPTTSIAAARIIDISDNHGFGTQTVPVSFALRFDPAVGLSWDDGEPVDVGVATAIAGDYRLYTPDYANWIDVRLSAVALPVGVATDNYNVFASKKDDENLLIGYFFWNGTAITDVTDKRYFGNLGYQELSDDLKATLKTGWNDLRGNMVYSGGTVTTAVTPHVVRVTGPLVAYVNGYRKVVPITFGGQYGFTGLSLTSSATNYLYVDSTGVLQISTIAPPIGAATIASVVCDSEEVLSIEDQRDPQLIVGQATRTARLRWTEEDALEWTPDAGTLKVSKDGSILGTELNVDVVSGTTAQFDMNAGLISGSAASFNLTTGTLIGNSTNLKFTDVNTGGVSQSLTDATNGTLGALQPSLPSASSVTSVFGAIADGQLAQQASLGVVSGCSVAVSSSGASIASGTFVDFSGRVVRLTASVTVAIPSSSGIYTLYWDSLARTFFFTNHGSLRWKRDVAFGILLIDGSVLTYRDCRIFAGGNDCSSFFSIGNDAPALGKANFQKIKTALSWRCCYSSTSYAPKTYHIYDQVDTTNSDLIDLDDFEFAGLGDRLNGLSLVGAPTGTNLSSPLLRWGNSGVASTKPFFNLRDQVSLRLSNLSFSYVGTVGATSDNCFIKDPGTLIVDNCSFGGNPCNSVVLWFNSYQLGGDLGPGTAFNNCTFYNTSSGKPMFSITGGTVEPPLGRLSFNGCSFNAFGSGQPSSVIEVLSNDNKVQVFINDCTFSMTSAALINDPTRAIDEDFRVFVVNSHFDRMGRLGATKFTNCNFLLSDNGIFSLGAIPALYEGTINTIQLSNCSIHKGNSNSASNTIFSTASNNLMINNCTISYINSSENEDPCFILSASATRYISIKDCDINLSARNCQMIKGLSAGSSTVEINSCKIVSGTGNENHILLAELPSLPYNDIKITNCTIRGAEDIRISLTGSPIGGVDSFVFSGNTISCNEMCYINSSISYNVTISDNSITSDYAYLIINGADITTTTAEAKNINISNNNFLLRDNPDLYISAGYTKSAIISNNQAVARTTNGCLANIVSTNAELLSINSNNISMTSTESSSQVYVYVVNAGNSIISNNLFEATSLLNASAKSRIDVESGSYERASTNINNNFVKAYIGGLGSENSAATIQVRRPLVKSTTADLTISGLQVSGISGFNSLVTTGDRVVVITDATNSANNGYWPIGAIVNNTTAVIDRAAFGSGVNEDNLTATIVDGTSNRFNLVSVCNNHVNCISAATNRKNYAIISVDGAFQANVSFNILRSELTVSGDDDYAEIVVGGLMPTTIPTADGSASNAAGRWLPLISYVGTPESTENRREGAVSVFSAVTFGNTIASGVPGILGENFSSLGRDNLLNVAGVKENTPQVFSYATSAGALGGNLSRFVGAADDATLKQSDVDDANYTRSANVMINT